MFGLGALPVADGALQLELPLLPLGGPAQALQRQVPVVENRQQVAGLNPVAGAHRRLAQEAVEAGDDAAPDGALQPRLGNDVIGRHARCRRARPAGPGPA